MPEYQGQEAVRTYPQVLSQETFVKCCDSFLLSDLQDTVHVAGVDPGVGRLVVEPGGDHVNGIDDHGHHHAGGEGPAEVDLP